MNCFARMWDPDAEECKICKAATECKICFDNDLAEAPLEEILPVILKVRPHSVESIARVLGVEKAEVEQALKVVPNIKKARFYKVKVKNEV